MEAHDFQHFFTMKPAIKQKLKAPIKGLLYKFMYGTRSSLTDSTEVKSISAELSFHCSLLYKFNQLQASFFHSFA